MSQFDQAFEQVKQLAEKFNSNASYYSSPSYQEVEARKDFIDKFFIALGWDVNHDLQRNPYEQEVKVEKGQRQQQATVQKRADYAFYTSPNFKAVKFFVEAKKPAVELKHPDNYFQTIRYGWNANTPLAILTDFEQFHIIDCRYKPDLKSVFTGKHKEYRYIDYLDKEKFAELYWLFSWKRYLDIRFMILCLSDTGIVFQI
jgi:adenine-specific DNA-methyltransferase